MPGIISMLFIGLNDPSMVLVRKATGGGYLYSSRLPVVKATGGVESVLLWGRVCLTPPTPPSSRQKPSFCHPEKKWCLARHGHKAHNCHVVLLGKMDI